MILILAPKYNVEQIRKIHVKLDKNKTGLVEKKQFLDAIGGYMDVKSKKKPKNAKNPYPIKKSLPTTCYENSRSQL